MTKTMAEAEKEAKLLASALGATHELAIMGFGGSFYVRLVFPQDDGSRFNFDMSTEGPHWKALVRLASKVQQ